MVLQTSLSLTVVQQAEKKSAIPLTEELSIREMGIPVVPHQARQITWSDYTNFDYIIGMDSANIRNLHRMLRGDPDKKISKLLDYTSRKGEDIADPWYTGNFDATYRDVKEGCEALLDECLLHL